MTVFGDAVLEARVVPPDLKVEHELSESPKSPNVVCCPKTDPLQRSPPRLFFASRLEVIGTIMVFGR